MHIPDNYLSPSTCAVMAAVMVPVWIVSAKKVKREISKKKFPVLGVCSAFSFLIMMFNLPVPGGTTAHAVGGTLAAILLGPYAATVCITMALAIQALFFGDGGILAFGANAFNMAFIMPHVGYALYCLLKSKFKKGSSKYIAAFVAAYMGIVSGAFFASIEFGIQPLFFKDSNGMPLYCPYGLNISMPAMIIPHAFIGVIEGFITASILAYLDKTFPKIIYENNYKSNKPFYGVLILLVILSPVGLIASGSAWGEWDMAGIKKITGYVPYAIKNGFKYNAAVPGYSIAGMGSIAGYIISAAAGAAIIIIVFKLVSLFKKLH